MSPAISRSRQRRWPFVVLCIVLLVAVLLGCSYTYFSFAGDQALNAAIAETDRLDPRWRMEDVEADRVVIPDRRNSGNVVIAAKGLLPEDWPAWSQPDRKADRAVEERREALERSFGDLEPQQQLNAEQIDSLRGELKRAAAALAEARKLAELSEGRYPITYAPDYISTLLPHTQKARGIANLLAFDAIMRVQDGDADGALASCRAALNAGRSVGDEPLLISVLVRIGCGTISLNRAERVLAQGQPSDGALLEFQQLLEKEEAVPLLLNGLRGERACQDGLMDAIQTGKVKPSSGLQGPGSQGSTLEDTVALWTPGFIKNQRAALLAYMNQAVEIAKLLPEQQQANFQQLEATMKDRGVVVRLLAPALSKIAAACHRDQVQLRCAIVMVAAERYGRAKGQWPDKIDTLKEAGYLNQTPIDIYDGQPLRLKRLEDGLVVYSVGPDGQDDGGKLDRQNPTAKGTDLGYRLWDVTKRRQPPAPPKPPDGPNDLPLPPENGK